MLFIIQNIRQMSCSNVEESSERYKIDGKITIQGFKQAGEACVCVSLCNS